MKAVFYDGEKRWIADTKEDEFLFGTPVNPPNTRTTYTRGTDLFVHRTKSGKVYLYFLDWSLWQGEEDRIREATVEEAQKFLERWLSSPWGPSEEELSRFKELTGIDLLEETA